MHNIVNLLKVTKLYDFKWFKCFEFYENFPLLEKKSHLKKKKKHLRQESEPGLRNVWWGWCGEDGAESREEDETGRPGDWEQVQVGLLPGRDWDPQGKDELNFGDVKLRSWIEWYIQSSHGRQCCWVASCSLTPSPLPWSDHLAVFTQNDCSFLSLHGGRLLGVLTVHFPLTPLLLLGSVSFSGPSSGKLTIWLGLGPLSSSQHPVFLYRKSQWSQVSHDTYIDVNPCRCLLLKIYLFMAALGLHCCMQPFSGGGAWGLLPGCSARASHCGGFSCCRAWVLECGLSGCSTQA